MTHEIKKLFTDGHFYAPIVDPEELRGVPTTFWKSPWGEDGSLLNASVMLSDLIPPQLEMDMGSGKIVWRVWRDARDEDAKESHLSGEGTHSSETFVGQGSRIGFV
jgi:hypothetical protein